MPLVRRLRTPVFATTPYEPDENGVLEAVLPTRCPFAPAGEGGCVIAEHHRRHRKTGPCFAIAVVRCKTHPVHYFTLYPPGHFPYGQKALVFCSVSGPVLLDPQTGKPSWGGTVFKASQEAASGERWSPDSAVGGVLVRRTQGRHIHLAGLLLGVHPDLDDGERERIATRLRVPTMALRSAASLWSEDWSTRGAAVVMILTALPVDGSLLDRLLSAGYAAGLWARPRRWDPPRRWEVARSDEPEQPPWGEARSRAPPSTTSHGEDATKLSHLRRHD